MLADDFDSKYWKRMNYIRSKANRSFDKRYASIQRSNRLFDSSQNALLSRYHSSSWTILKIVFILILVSVVFGFLTGTNQSTTFSGFLQWLGTEDFSLVRADYINNSIGGQWLIGDGIRLFLNAIITVFDLASFVCRNIVNAVFMGGKFLTYFFGLTGANAPV